MLIFEICLNLVVPLNTYTVWRFFEIPFNGLITIDSYIIFWYSNYYSRYSKYKSINSFCYVGRNEHHRYILINDTNIEILRHAIQLTRTKIVKIREDKILP